VGIFKSKSDIIIARFLHFLHIFSDFFNVTFGFLYCLEHSQCTLFQLCYRTNLDWIELVWVWVVFNCLLPLFRVNWALTKIWWYKISELLCSMLGNIISNFVVKASPKLIVLRHGVDYFTILLKKLVKLDVAPFFFRVLHWHHLLMHVRILLLHLRIPLLLILITKHCLLSCILWLWPKKTSLILLLEPLILLLTS